jgi:hypothetical protein
MRSDLIVMSPKELARLEAMHALRSGTATQVQIAKRLRVSVRQVKRLWRAFGSEGEAGLVSKQRGRPGNRRHVTGFLEEAIGLVGEHYADFGPTLACEKLAERHGAAGFWKAKRRRRAYHPPRERRPRFGELVQIDGSPHAWFEDRGPKCTLLVFIDDATSRLVALRFVKAESTDAYFTLANEYFRRYGLPEAFYSDRFSVFRHNQNNAIQKDPTQFARAMDQLGIELICANSPQAKGRVERANQTLQDRLVKELRLAGACDIAAGNAFLEQYRLMHNERFAAAPAEPQDAHRSLDGLDLDQILASSTPRKLSKDLLLQYDSVVYQITTTTRRLVFPRAAVNVIKAPDGTITIERNGISLDYCTVARVAKTQIRSAKDLDAPPNRQRGPNPKKAHKPVKQHPWHQLIHAQSQEARARKGDISKLHEGDISTLR